MNFDEALVYFTGVYLEATGQVEGIRSISKAWRETPSGRHDYFLFDDVYRSLWDGVVIKIAALWDDNVESASLARMRDFTSPKSHSLELQNYCNSLFEDSRSRSTELGKIRQWRHQAIAHRRKAWIDRSRGGGPMTIDEFDELYRPSIEAIERVLKFTRESIEMLIQLSGAPVSGQGIDEAASLVRKDVSKTMRRWSFGAIFEERVKREAGAAFKEANTVTFEDLIKRALGS